MAGLENVREIRQSDNDSSVAKLSLEMIIRQTGGSSTWWSMLYIGSHAKTVLGLCGRLVAPTKIALLALSIKKWLIIQQQNSIIFHN